MNKILFIFSGNENWWKFINIVLFFYLLFCRSSLPELNTDIALRYTLLFFSPYYVSVVIRLLLSPVLWNAVGKKEHKNLNSRAIDEARTCVTFKIILNINLHL